ncbi:hypothetical protein AB0I69_24525 [Streptomyces sp. NPDC050508]|uniref:hypothetical protein n=1 Tax=Streptomyces sp. NPDC050508 TaxID=3155405 RepID=UPI0034248551
MKLRTPPPERRRVTVARPDGSTFETLKTVEFAPEAVPPRDWDVISTRAGVGLVLALTAVAVAWSTWSIGSLLHGGLGFLAATVFDLSWATCLILEWKARYDPDKRAFPRALGWALLVVTMGAIFWHGAPDWRMATVGALTSAIAKVLWLGIMKHIERELSQQDRDDLADRLSKAHVRQAVALVDRQTLRVDAHTEALRRSLEGARPTVLELSASTQDTDRAELASAGEQFAEQLTQAEPRLSRVEPVAQVTASVQAAPAEPELSPSEPHPPFGFSAASAQRVQRTEAVTELLRAEPGLTGAQVAERLGVSLASGKRYLADARKEVQS